MRFSVAMDSLEKEIKLLRIVVISLFVLAIALCIGILRVAQKNPLVVERGCLSRVLPVTAGESSKEEIQSFLELALAQRFNSKFSGTELLSADQQIARDQEQKELAKLNMRQLIVVDSVEVDGNKVSVSADRLVSANDIRSAFKWPLDVEVLSVQRSDANPYGLILSSVKKVEEKPHQGVPSK